MVLETVHFEAVAAAVGSFLAMPAFLFGPKVLDVLESSLVDDPDGSNKAALLSCFALWTSISGILRMRDPSRESSSTPTIWGQMGLTTRCLLSCNDLVLGDVPHIGMDPPLRDRTQLFWSLNPPIFQQPQLTIPAIHNVLCPMTMTTMGHLVPVCSA